MGIFTKIVNGIIGITVGIPLLIILFIMMSLALGAIFSILIEFLSPGLQESISWLTSACFIVGGIISLGFAYEKFKEGFDEAIALSKI